MDVIILEGMILGAVGFALMSAVSMIRKRHRRGVLFGISSMVSYMLFTWLWYSAFTHHGSTWVELAFRSGSRDFKQNTAFLVYGLVLTLVNVMGIIRQMKLNQSAPPAAD